MNGHQSEEAARFDGSHGDPYPHPNPNQNTGPPLGHWSSSTLSMRHKKERKKNASAHHNCNFHAGYVPVTEEVLHRTGIRGRKRYFLYCILTVLLIVALLNTMVVAALVYVLGLTHQGLSHLEILQAASQSSMFHVFVPTYASAVSMRGAPLGARHSSNISLVSVNHPVRVNGFNSSTGGSPQLEVDTSSITVQADSLRVKDDRTGHWTSLDMQTLASTHTLSNFAVDGITTRKLQRDRNVADLYLESPMREVNISGAQGVDIASMKLLEAEARNILLQSEQSVVFQPKHSLYLEGVPRVEDTPGSGPHSAWAHRLCLCGNGQLFVVSVDSADRSIHACDIGAHRARKVCGESNKINK